jgi:hypothetical protein
MLIASRRPHPAIARLPVATLQAGGILAFLR